MNDLELTEAKVNELEQDAQRYSSFQMGKQALEQLAYAKLISDHRTLVAALAAANVEIARITDMCNQNAQNSGNNGYRVNELDDQLTALKAANASVLTKVREVIASMDGKAMALKPKSVECISARSEVYGAKQILAILEQNAEPQR